MAKLRKVTLYILDSNDPLTDEDIRWQLSTIKHLPFVNVGEIESADIGEWHDDHELNKRGADHEKYFK